MADEDTVLSGEGNDGPAGGQGDDTIAADASDTLDAGTGDAADAGQGTEAAPDPIPAKPAAELPAKKPEPQPDPLDEDLKQLDADIADAEKNYGADDAIVRSLKRSQKISQEQQKRLKDAEPALSESKQNADWRAFMLENKVHEIPAENAGKATREALEADYKAFQEAEVKAGTPAEFISWEATKKLRQKISELKGPATKPAPKKPGSTPVLAKGQVLPRGVGAVPNQPAPKDTRTVEERLLAGDLNKDLAQMYDELLKQ